jgi:hypothetical protein
LHVRRVKNGKPATHPIRGDELRALRQLKREQRPQSAFVFTTERGTPFTPAAILNWAGRGQVMLSTSRSIPTPMPSADDRGQTSRPPSGCRWRPSGASESRCAGRNLRRHEKGSRPCASHDQRTQSTYLFGAVGDAPLRARKNLRVSRLLSRMVEGFAGSQRPLPNANRVEASFRPGETYLACRNAAFPNQHRLNPRDGGTRPDQ